MTKGKIKTLIIEDEKEDLDLMLNLLKKHTELQIAATAGDVEEGIAAVSFHKPDLLFLDINLYGRTSFEILDVVKKYNLKTKVIFTTAFDNYMNKAFKYAAFDYLLKPIDREELSDTINRFVNQINETDFNQSYERFKSVHKKIILNTTEGYEIISPDSICYISTVKNQSYTEIFLNDGKKITVSKTIGEIETLIPEKDFIKIHRSYILNIKYVKKVNRIKQKCYLISNEISYKIPISREKAKLLKEKINLMN